MARPLDLEITVHHIDVQLDLIAAQSKCAEVTVHDVRDLGSLLSLVGSSLGHFAAAGLTVTPERRKLLNFTHPYLTVTQKVIYRRGDYRPKTVMDLIGTDVKERIFPVGRLDRETTGLLVLTNDGELAKKLSHPSYNVKKIYHVVLDKPVTKNDLQKIREGLNLEDGKAVVDGVDHVRNKGKNEVGIEIHIGKNRIVRRIFEHLGYEVVKLDRMYYGGLTKKDLPRGRFRLLTEQEAIFLKHF